MERVFVVPLKPFARAKTRLRDAGTPAVTALARTLALGVIHELREQRLVIAADDDEIEVFAREHGLPSIRSPQRGLNPTVTSAYHSLSANYRQVIIVHGDIRSPSGLAAFAPGDGVTIVPDRHQRGTNILALPAATPFRFQYGADSCERHGDEARRCGLPLTILSGSPWAHDVDLPDDL